MVWAFWIIIPAAVLLALIAIYTPKGFKLYEQARKYPGLLRAAEEAEQRVTDLERLNATLSKSAESRYVAGLREGRDEVIGAVMAATSLAELDLTALAIRDGAVYVVASIVSGDVPAVGSRFSVEVKATGEKKAIVVVESWDRERGHLWLRGIPSERNKGFLDSLAALADAGHEVPRGLVLEVPRVRIDETDAANDVGGRVEAD